MNSKINKLRGFFDELCKKYNKIIITRKRKLNFTHMLYFLLKINFSSEMYSTVNKDLKNNKIVSVSKQALSKKRQLIKSSYIKDIFNSLVTHVKDNGMNKKANIYAVDGSKLSYKKCLSEEGFKLTPNKTYTKSLLSTLYDTDNKIPVDFIVTKTFDERSSFIHNLMGTLKKDDTIIFDRGYYSHELIKNLTQNKLKYVIRMVMSSSLVKDLEKNKSKDEIFVVNDQFIVRVVKYTINKTNYFMATNNYTCHIDHIKELYHKRWTIEEFYKTLKVDLKGNSFTSNNLNKIIQDLSSKMINEIIARYLEHLVNTHLQACHKHYNLNHKVSLLTLKDDIINLLLFKKSNKKLISQLHIMKKEIVYCKPNRHFNRIRISPVSKFYFNKATTILKVS